MYVVDELDTVLQSHEAPWPDAGAPLPVVLCNEHNLFLAYIVAAQEAGGIREVSPKTSGLSIAIVKFLFYRSYMFGPPNDEAFTGHPLASRGLGPYAVSEVEQSSWIRQLERMNAVHPNHRPELFASYRHFVFTFHDSTFEVVADGFEVQLMSGSMRSAVSKMVEMFTQDK
jgi:hypothetical protein